MTTLEDLAKAIGQLNRKAAEMNNALNVYIGGTFDGLHPGHLRLINTARRLAGPRGLVIVAVNSDEFVARYKKVRVALPQADRIELLRAIKGVNRVVANIGDEDSGKTIDAAAWSDNVLSQRVDIILAGDDWARADYLGQLGITQAWLDERGIQILYVPRVGGHASSKHRNLGEAHVEIKPGWNLPSTALDDWDNPQA